MAGCFHRSLHSVLSMSKIEAPPPGFRLLHSLQIGSLKGEDVWLGRLKWSPSGASVAVGASDEAIWVWDARTGRVLRRVHGDSRSVVAFAWMGDTTILTWSSKQPCLRSQSVLDGSSREVKLEGIAGAILGLDCSPDSQKIACVTDDQKLRLWETKTGKLILELEEPRGVSEVVWSPTGAQLALRDSEGSSWLRDAKTGEQLVMFPAHDSLVHAFSWSPDAKLLALGFGKAVIVKSVETSRIVHRLVGHSERIKAVSFSADGSLLASKSYDGTVRIWRCDRWEEVAVLEETTSDGMWPPGIAFHPRDSILATLGKVDKVVRLWCLDVLSEKAERERRWLKAVGQEDQRLSALEWDFREWVVISLSKLSNEQAKRHLFNGFLQRNLMMSASRERIFNETHNRGDLLSPELTTELNIHVNAYYLNLRGALDNLAWMLAFELELKPGLSEEGKGSQFADLFRNDFQSALKERRPDLVRWLRKLERWRSDVKAFRDPAAHRIPLYVTPGIQTDGNRGRRETLERAASEALSEKDFSTYTSLQYEIRNLAEYHPTFIKSKEVELEFYGLAGQLQRDQRVFLRIARTVLRELLGPFSSRRYREWLASRRRLSPFSFFRMLHD